MANNLPKVYASPINKKLDNNLEYSVSGVREIKKEAEKSILKKINEIFASPSHVYKSRVRITLVNKEIEEVVVGRNSKGLLTLDGKTISIRDILDIEKI